MKKKRNIKIFSFVLCLVATLFALGWNRISAETPEVSISGKLVDTISNVQVSNNEGGNLDWELGQWATFRINADFNLAGKNVKKGDTTDITVPLTMSKNIQIPRAPSSSMRVSTLRNTHKKGKSLLKLPSTARPRLGAKSPLKGSEMVTQEP